MRFDGTPSSRPNAKHLRKQMTPPEIALWLALRRNEAGLRFRRQHPVGDYVLDFYCAPARLAVEVDGDAHGYGDRPERDAVRDRWLASRGVLVMRYPAREVFINLDGIVREIVALAGRRREAAGSSLSAPSVA